LSKLTPDQARHVLLIGLALTALIGLAQPALELPERVGRNHNEGWNALHTAAAMRGDPIYPDRDAWLTNNYPPLSYYVVGVVSIFVGDAIRAGRMISLLSLLTVGFCALWVTRRITGSTWAGTIAGLLLVATLSMHFDNYVAMNDPQMLGHAFQFLGLAVLIGGADRRARSVACLLLLLLGGLVKHNLMAVPLGVTAWIFLYRRSEFRFWMVGAITSIVFAIGALYLIFGSELFAAVVGYQRSYELYLLGWILILWLIPIGPLLAGGLAALLVGKLDVRARLFLIIGAFATLIGTVAGSGVGISYNAVFDVVRRRLALDRADLAADRLADRIPGHAPARLRSAREHPHTRGAPGHGPRGSGLHLCQAR
jgi:hypothetical protein